MWVGRSPLAATGAPPAAVHARDSGTRLRIMPLRDKDAGHLSTTTLPPYWLNRHVWPHLSGLSVGSLKNPQVRDMELATHMETSGSCLQSGQGVQVANQQRSRHHLT